MNGKEQNGIRLIWGISAVLALSVSGALAAELPPAPNNAALLYYQALALWSDVRSSYADTNAIQEPNDWADTRPNAAKPELDRAMAALEQIEREQEEADRESSRQKDTRPHDRTYRGRIPNTTLQMGNIPFKGMGSGRGWGITPYRLAA
ncbi:MAG: hypothetical protein JSW47_14155 [Phycisphaerales bacterium]|nr:MAG: hypothetical protein JSW47_14155 [Phycisphaerales bacterium]